MNLVVPVAIGVLIVGSAALAMSLRNIIRSVLCLTLNWFGVAAFYLWAGAEFVAFAQVLVYVGAVSMVVLFAVLLTRHRREEVGTDPGHEVLTRQQWARGTSGVVTAAVVAGILCGAVVTTSFPTQDTAAGSPELTVRMIGERLAGPAAATLLIVGVLLTVALIGAVVIASRDAPAKEEVRS